MPASLKQAAQQLPGPSAETLADLAAVQPLRQEAFSAWSPGQTWFSWCSTTSTTLTMNDTAWTTWNNGVATTAGSLAFNYATSTAYVSTGTSWVAWNAGYQETGDQRLEREERERVRQAEWQARYEEQERERARTQARALELLRSLLSGEQWENYQDKGWFEVTGSSGRRWRVRNRGQSGNVDLMPETGEEREATYCAHPPGGLPDADAHAAQMLALVTDDEAFLRTANRHWVRARMTQQQREVLEEARVLPFMRTVA